MSEQTVNVSIIPGDLTYSPPTSKAVGLTWIRFSGLTVTDTRGGEQGWRLVGAFPQALKLEATLTSKLEGSADGVNTYAHVWLEIIKDETVGPAGSTGGQYVFDVFVQLPTYMNPDEFEFPEMRFKE